MSENTETLLEAVQEAARMAGDVAARHFGTRLAVDTKEDGSPVTAADREAERAVREWIEHRFPRDGILGEEFGLVRGDSPRRWVLDPIDGTRTFVRGVPLYGSLVAVLEGEQVLAGAAYYPSLGELLAAAPGCGCWWNGRRAQVSSISCLTGALVLTTDERFEEDTGRLASWNRLSSQAAMSRSWGDCYGYLLVATGRAEVMVDGVLSPWDAAAFLPIIEEAGGVFTDWAGRRTIFGGSAVATNRALASTVRASLAGHPTALPEPADGRSR